MKLVQQWLAAGSLLLVVMSAVHAADSAKPDNTAGWFDSGYAGVGLQRNFGYASFETETPYALVYGRLGLIYKSDMAVQIGFRKPYHLTGHDKDGYYLGGFVGDMGAVSYFKKSQNSKGDDIFTSERANRMGIGAEFAYLWHNSQRLSAASVSLGYLQEATAGSGNQKKEFRGGPTVSFGYTFQVKFF